MRRSDSLSCPCCGRPRSRLALWGAVLLLGPFASVLPAGAQSVGSSTATGISNQFNPALSVNALFLAQTARDDTSPARNGIALQEAEAQLAAVVDPFWKAAVTIALHPVHAAEDASHGDLEDEGTGGHHAEAEGYAVEVEEAYIDGRALPAGLALRLGRFYVPFGKHQQLHTHQFPFTEAPIAIQSLLGDHPLIENGATLTASLPLPWFGEALAYAVDGGSEPFDAGNRDLVYGARLRQLWDLSDATTLELGGSYLQGPDGAHPGEGLSLDLYGLDMTLKWISLARTRGPALTVQGELLLPRPEARSGEPHGWWGLAQYRWHRNWWWGAGYGIVDVDARSDAEPTGEMLGKRTAGWPGSSSALPLHEHVAFTGEVREAKLNLVFAPSEFSALRAEVAWLDDRAGDADDLRFLLQWNFTIGSHPAHHY